MALPYPYENLDESKLLGLIVNHSYEGFIPVRNATAGLDAYELMSVMITRKRKRDETKAVFGAPFKKMGSIFSSLWATASKNEHQGGPALDHQLFPAPIFDDPTGIPNESVEPKKIAEQRSVFNLGGSRISAKTVKTSNGTKAKKNTRVITNICILLPGLAIAILVCLKLLI